MSAVPEPLLAAAGLRKMHSTTPDAGEVRYRGQALSAMSDGEREGCCSRPRCRWQRSR